MIEQVAKAGAKHNFCPDSSLLLTAGIVLIAMSLGADRALA
jgi:hypothetical protein